jgi:hypothetical protein
MKLNGATGGAVWFSRYGDAADQSLSGVALDSLGSVLVTGAFMGTIDFGDGPLTSAGNTDIVVAKMDPNGAHVWSKRFGDPFIQLGASIAPDADRNVVVTGSMQGTVDFGGGPKTSAGGYDIFVVKLDSQGNHLWDKVFGDPSAQYGFALAVDGKKNVIVAGSAQGTVDFGGGPKTSAGSDDAAVVKLDPSGAHLWSGLYGDLQSQYAYGVAADAAGNVVLVGGFNGTIQFGTNPMLTSHGSADVFVAKLGPNAGYAWSKGFGSSGYDTATAVASDATGAELIVGTFNNTVDFGGTLLSSLGSGNLFVAKLAP